MGMLHLIIKHLLLNTFLKSLDFLFRILFRNFFLTEKRIYLTEVYPKNANSRHKDRGLTKTPRD